MSTPTQCHTGQLQGRRAAHAGTGPGQRHVFVRRNRRRGRLLTRHLPHSVSNITVLHPLLCADGIASARAGLCAQMPCLPCRTHVSCNRGAHVHSAHMRPRWPTGHHRVLVSREHRYQWCSAKAAPIALLNTPRSTIFRVSAWLSRELCEAAPQHMSEVVFKTDTSHNEKQRIYVDLLKITSRIPQTDDARRCTHIKHSNRHLTPCRLGAQIEEKQDMSGMCAPSEMGPVTVAKEVCLTPGSYQRQYNSSRFLVRQLYAQTFPQ